ncbi:MAG: NAD(P)/FAD-dependent oxidoreductase [Candidatus Omnitrophota bacterium]
MNNKYDDIIIGAGIGGLVCGCYLAKQGRKVLIVEQHFQAGGYCSSFKRKGFTFDTSIHSIGSLREGGKVRKIFNELGLEDEIELTRSDPTDILIFPGHTIFIRNKLNDTIASFQESFPHEFEKIKDFFYFIYNFDFIKNYSNLKTKTFKDVLNIYFQDEKLKSIISIILGNIGLPASRVAALPAIVLYKEFILDGGYYPKGGMQSFSNGLARKFKKLGGELRLKNKVEKIIIKKNKAVGIIIGKEEKIFSDNVISNCDATHTFLDLIGKKFLSDKFVKKIDNLETSASAFVVYLGLNKSYNSILKNRCSWWCYLSDKYDVEKVFSDIKRKNKPYSDNFVFCIFTSSHDRSLAPERGETISLVSLATVKDLDFWKKNKEKFADDLIKRAEKFIPELSKHIIVKEIATPHTMQRYTLNKDGAAYGWASTVTQIDKEIMPRETNIKNLYLTGHWTTQGSGQGGVSTVAYSGRSIAKLLIRRKNFYEKKGIK